MPRKRGNTSENGCLEDFVLPGNVPHVEAMVDLSPRHVHVGDLLHYLPGHLYNTPPIPQGGKEAKPYIILFTAHYCP